MILKIIAISLMMMSSAVNAYNILIVAPMPFKSNFMFLERIIGRLLDRGYYLTLISPFKNNFKEDNLKEITIPKFNVEDIFPSKGIFNGNFESDISYIQAQYKIGLAVSEHTLSQPEVKKFIQNMDYKYDVVLVDSSYLDSLYMFSYKFGCPLIIFDPNGHNNFLDEAMGVMTPHSFIPHPVSKYENNMTYMQRCYNALLHIFEAAVRKFSYIPAQNKLARKYFSGGIKGEIPHIDNVVKNISLVLSNTFRVSQKRPKMAAQVDIAGAHFQEVYGLPADLKEIVANSQGSVIYFSFGSYLKPSEMPKEKLDEIIKAFGKMKKTILWQYDGDIPAGLPNNIIMQKWFPQNDLLANKRVVLFITHGGTLSYQEALSNRVPMLIIPFTGEQYRNALQAERGHYGEMLLFDDLNEQTLTEKIQRIADDNTYFTSISAVSSRLLDAPIESFKEATFWIQHVCKYKGIEKSLSVHLSWITYLSLDVFALYFGILLTCILFWVLTIKLILRRYRNREQKGKFKYY